MPIKKTVTEDVKDTTQEKVEEVKEVAQSVFENTKERWTNLTVNQKLIVTAVAAIGVSLLIQKVSKKLRPAVVEATRLVVLEPLNKSDK